MTRFVIAEDNPDILRLIQRTFLNHGHQVTTAVNGQEAWHAIQLDVPDVAVLDMNMPALDGIEVCRRIRSDPRTRNVSVIFLSAYDQAEIKAAASAVGADDYLLKPFGPGQLLSRVEEILRRREIELELTRRDAGRRDQPTMHPLTGGQIVALTGAKGGVGTSILATNVAVALALDGHRVCLVDFDLEHAVDTMLLGLTPRHSIANLLLHMVTKQYRTVADLSGVTAPELQWGVLREHLLVHASGVAVLPGPISAAHAELVTGDHARLMLRLLQSHFDHVIVDLATGFREVNLDSFDLCDRLLVVMTPDHGAVRLLRSAVSVMEQVHIPHEKLEVVVNQPQPFAMLSPADLKREVGLRIIGSIPYGDRPVVETFHTGIPVVQKLPDQAVSVAIRQMARTVSVLPARTR